ncbi:hypothetical protein [Campylobacter devanensis]|uniref:hypothetical protein n=1 Tax=Campylobacter devanensis TaxID=3161138 RepID=UPI0015D6B5D9|nr:MULTISPECIES: hypothetical protein [unclassified Campylobacter]
MGRKNSSEPSIAMLVKKATRYNLNEYCYLRKLSVTSLYNGYISKKAAKILASDGIKVG